MSAEEATCGEELAASAEVPEALGALLKHVALNMETHAHWVGAETETARKEQEAMLLVAREYNALGDAASNTATKMRSLKELAPTPHDPTKFDWVAFQSWMEKKIELQRRVAQLLLSHATESEVALQHLRGRL